jgi:hypothetical protein
VQLFINGKGLEAVDAEHVVEPLGSVDMQVGENTGCVTGWGLGGLFGGSGLGSMSEAMLVWVRVWGVRLTTAWMIPTCVPRRCERSSFARGCIFR